MPAEQPARASVVSGYFNPLHAGHLDLFEAARDRTGYLIVVVNNDEQQLLKKGRLIVAVDARARIVRALRMVDDVVVAVESTPHLDATLDLLRSRYPRTVLEFCNGGDRSSAATLTGAEREAARRNGIELVYGVGGTGKADSSTRIQEAIELE